jgi:hypothetical protein
MSTEQAFVSRPKCQAIGLYSVGLGWSELAERYCLRYTKAAAPDNTCSGLLHLRLGYAAAQTGAGNHCFPSKRAVSCQATIESRNQKDRNEWQRCNKGYATCSGALAIQFRLFQSPSSRLRHWGVHQPVPIYSEMIFEVAAHRHRLSDNGSLLDPRPSPSRGRGRLQVVVPQQRMPCRGADGDVTSRQATAPVGGMLS